MPEPPHQRPAHKCEFTLIERVPSKASITSRLRCADPANFPFRAGSLTGVIHSNVEKRSPVTKSRDGKLAEHGGLWPVPKALPGNGKKQIAGRLNSGQRGTPSQSERRGKGIGRRTTNVREHRKEWHGWYCWQSHVDSGEPLFYGRSLIRTGKKVGTRTRATDGVKDGGMS